MIVLEANNYIAKNIITKNAIENELGIDITNNLLKQIKKDISKSDIGKEIFPSEILGEKSGSWRNEYQAV